ncbi:MAG: beta-Ig-H3/fasciclin [Polaromonas sp.]|nr:beta-Ig-H3/fasciclin [Polaromonas sp.]
MLKRHFVLSLATAAAAALVAGCATGARPVSVADTLAAQARLSTLSSLVAKAGLTDTLKAGGPFTVFAPTNEAFAKVPAKTLETLASDPAQLKAVLGYHVLPAKVLAADVKNGNSKTLNGANVALSRAGDFVTVEEALVVTPDILATNGVVHVVDSVLLPPASR